MADVPAITFRKATIRKRSLLAQKTLNAALGGKDIWEIDSKGYMGNLRLLVAGTETTSTADPVSIADWPWALFNRINVRDSSGGMLRNHKGYSGYIADRYFQPWKGIDLSATTDADAYSVSIAAVQVNNIRFALDLSIEAGTRDNLGLVPNQNAAFKYTLEIDWETEANLVTTAANSAFALTVQPSYRYYTVPAPQRGDGTPQQVVPPFAGVVRQVWDEPQNVPSAAENRYNLTPGRVIRNLAFIARTSAGVRLASGIDRIKLYYGDDTLLFDATEQDIKTEHYRLFNDTAPAGVYVISFTYDNDGFNGADFRRDILDTRRLAQFYAAITTAATVTSLDIVHDELIVPATMSL
jgi:hypothetical protein